MQEPLSEASLHYGTLCTGKLNELMFEKINNLVKLHAVQEHIKLDSFTIS